jgi:hypothetical protein
MIRTVSLWIRINGRFSLPLYKDDKQTRLKPQDGEYYLRCAGMVSRGHFGLPHLEGWIFVEPIVADAELEKSRSGVHACGGWYSGHCPTWHVAVRAFLRVAGVNRQHLFRSF